MSMAVTASGSCATPTPLARARAQNIAALSKVLQMFLVVSFMVCLVVARRSTDVHSDWSQV
jgi:hypothetical protein